MQIRVVLLVLVMCVCVFASSGITQEYGMIQQLEEGEKDAIEAIALYPEEERYTILTATMYPEIMVRMEQIRKHSEAEFQVLMSTLSEDHQKEIYNLTRYPELLDMICNRNARRSRSEMRDLLNEFPEEIHEDAMSVNRKHLGIARDVNNLLKDSEKAFNKILDNYPENVQQAFHKLEQLPEVLSILNDHMSLTVLLGDLYKNDQDALLYTLDSLNVVLAEEKASELKAWKEALENDPDAMYEYEQAARKFADEQGYDDDLYAEPTSDRYRTDVYVRYVWRPYPYWFGWPVWYDYECWYPYPWWYHWGFYYAPNNVIVFVGLPSNVFVNWHFRYYSHFYYYPHFTNRVMSHFYYGPRRADSNIRPIIRDWENANRDQLPKDWFKNDGQRAERIQEYGRFKLDYETAVRDVYAGTPSEREFLRDNAGRYPTLKPVLKDSPRPAKMEPRTPQYSPDPSNRPEMYQPRDKVIDRSQTIRQEEVERAVERHENIWKRMTREPTRSASPSPRSPSKSPAQKSSPRKKNN